MSTLTPNYQFILPGVNDPTDQDLWGGYLNSNLSAQDTLIKSVSDKANLSSPATNPKTGNYTVLASDQNKVITVDATGGAATITLLDVATAGDGFMVSVKKNDSTANTVTVDGSGAETIDGQASIIFTDQYDIQTYICNGSTWYVKSEATSSSNQNAGIYLYQTAATLIPVSTWTDLTWDSEYYDDFGWHTGSSSDITVDFTGYLDIRLSGNVNVDSNGTAGLRVVKNGTAVTSPLFLLCASAASAGLPIGTPMGGLNIAEIIPVTSGDVIKGQIWRNGYAGSYPTVTGTTRIVVTKYRE